MAGCRFGLQMSLNMLLELGDVFDYTGADFAAWCKEAGFATIEVMPLAEPSSVAIAIARRFADAST